MSTTYDILDRLYPFLNVATVTNTINGRVYRRKRPLNSAKRDVVLTSLTLPDGEGMDVQPGTVFINSYIALDKETGEYNESTLKATAQAIISRLAVWNPSTTYCHFEVLGENTFEDTEQPGWAYSSIRLSAIIE